MFANSVGILATSLTDRRTDFPKKLEDTIATVYQKPPILLRTSRKGVTLVFWVIACAKWNLPTGRR